MSIFISFSGTVREKYALKFLKFFNDYGIHCWYDQHELLLGDLLKETIISQGIDKSHYHVILINQTFLESEWPCEEARQIFKKSDKEVIFPILIDLTKDDLQNSTLSYLLNTKYQFLKSEKDIHKIGFQILNRIFSDMLSKARFNSIEKATKYFEKLLLSNSIDIYNALQTYSNFDETHYRDRTIFLICLIRLFNNTPFEKTIKKISYYLYNNDDITFDMYKVIEYIFLISIEIYLC